MKDAPSSPEVRGSTGSLYKRLLWVPQELGSAGLGSAWSSGNDRPWHVCGRCPCTPRSGAHNSCLIRTLPTHSLPLPPSSQLLLSRGPEMSVSGAAVRPRFWPPHLSLDRGRRGYGERSLEPGGVAGHQCDSGCRLVLFATLGPPLEARLVSVNNRLPDGGHGATGCTPGTHGHCREDKSQMADPRVSSTAA